MSDILYDSGVLSDVDIREFWGKGIEIDTYQKGDWAFDLDKQLQLKHQANQKIADMLKEETNKTISLVLNELSLSMKNKFERSDA